MNNKNKNNIFKCSDIINNNSLNIIGKKSKSNWYDYDHLKIFIDPQNNNLRLVEFLFFF